MLAVIPEQHSTESCVHYRYTAGITTGMFAMFQLLLFYLLLKFWACYWYSLVEASSGDEHSNGSYFTGFRHCRPVSVGQLLPDVQTLVVHVCCLRLASGIMLTAWVMQFHYGQPMCNWRRLQFDCVAVMCDHVRQCVCDVIVLLLVLPSPRLQLILHL